MQGLARSSRSGEFSNRRQVGFMLGPIFNREWLILPRRPGQYFSRTLYLGALWVLLLTIWQTAVGWEYTATFGDLARFGTIAFRVLAFVDVVHNCF